MRDQILLRKLTSVCEAISNISRGRVGLGVVEPASAMVDTRSILLHVFAISDLELLLAGAMVLDRQRRKEMGGVSITIREALSSQPSLSELQSVLPVLDHDETRRSHIATVFSTCEADGEAGKVPP
jgi:hypothetical protein